MHPILDHYGDLLEASWIVLLGDIADEPFTWFGGSTTICAPCRSRLNLDSLQVERNITQSKYGFLGEVE